MRSIVNLIKQLKTDEDGAPLIEYTVLLGHSACRCDHHYWSCWYMDQRSVGLP